jgi:hypothetical protein
MKGHQTLWLVSRSQDVEYKVSARWIFQRRFHKRGPYVHILANRLPQTL